MALPHYSNDQTSKKGKNFEPVFANMFEVTILPPAGVGGQEMLIQHINSISGLELHKELGVVDQKFKWSTRSFSGIPGDSFLDVTVNFSLNLNDAWTLNLLKILIKSQILEVDLEILILKSKRIIKTIKNISGLKNIVFDSQI